MSSEFTPSPGTRLVLPSSEVSGVGQADGAWWVRLAVAAIEGGHAPGFLTGVTLVCPQVRQVRCADDLLGTVAQAELVQADRRVRQLTWPIELDGDVTMSLWLVNGASCEVSGRGLRAVLAPDARWHEWMGC
ncbi:hypothetical protein WNB94_10915 [Aquabacterium sp. A3]|uniref:hypothetical protein n=1 Tax=Aquabacterium sp. A3 TaxID=3132829 RepID=UPI00311A5786